MFNLFKSSVEWVKSNRLMALLIVIILYLLLKGNTASYNVNKSFMSYDSSESAVSSVPGRAMMDGDMMGKAVGSSQRLMMPPIAPDAAPMPDISDRKVVTNSDVSLVVKNVRDAVSKISDEVKNKKGYVVNKYINTPQSLESGSIVVRVPSDQVDGLLAFLRNLGTKVVNENISSNDITDQYVDVEERLKILTENKTRFEEIMHSATNVDEILRVQEQIFNLQSQIDSLKGQLQYMDGTTKTSLITVSLSTDEISLPYTPDKPFRPEVIFKEAVRSLIKDVRGFASSAIWIVVYSALWLPLLGLGFIIYAFLKRKQNI